MVADSTTEAEYIVASEAAKEGVWIRKFLIELGVFPNASSPLRERNHPLPVKVRDDGCRRQPLPRQVPQRLGEHFELGLMLGGLYPPVPLLRPLPEHLIGERR